MVKVIRSFGYAGKGIMLSFGERNVRIHFISGAAVVALGLFFQLALFEWAVLFLCIGVVITAELMNTAIEELGTIITTHNKDAYEKMGAPKDLAAGAVLISAITAAVVGAAIFWPHVLRWLAH